MKINIQMGELADYSIVLSKENAVKAYEECLKSLNAYMFMKAENPNKEIEICKNTTKINPFVNDDFFNYKKLVAYMCPKCKKITTRFMELSSKNVTHCHFCRRGDIEILEVSKANYECICGNTAYLYMANGLDKVDCRECGKIIHLKG